MSFKNTISYLLSLLILLSGLIIAPGNFACANQNNLQKIQSKIKELKYKEKVELNKLSKTQQRLESTQSTIQNYQNELWRSRKNISNLQSKLDYLQREQDLIADRAGTRIRNIYKGERFSVLHLLFDAENLGTFLDRLYYQQRMAQRDKEVIENLKEKAAEIHRSQRAVEYEKKNISSTLRIMNYKKNELNKAIQTSKYLIDKLQTDRIAYETAQKELANLSKDIENTLVKTISEQGFVNATFMKPVIGAISSPYGWRVHPIFKSRKFHSGVDIAGPNRSPIKASNEGKVIHSGWYGGYGKVVIVNHGVMQNGQFQGKKVSTLYAHMARTSVTVGDYVKKGQVVGYEGSTGYSTGPHLHFEVRINGKTTNPMSFIR